MDWSLENFLIIVITLNSVIYLYFKWKFQYWKLRNVDYLEPSIPLGNTPNPFTNKEHISFKIKRHYDEFKLRGSKIGGTFFLASPSLVIVDLDIAKNILIKDFQNFTHRGFFHNEKDDPLSGHLFALDGPKWKKLRSKMSPTFSSGKMKMMFQTLLDCVPNLLKTIESKKFEPIDIKEVLACFTTDVIGSCAFGLDCKTFEDEDSPFRKYGRLGLATTPKQMLKRMLSMLFPNFAKKLHLALTPKKVTHFFINLVKDTIKYRQDKKVERNDFLQLLINLKNENSLNIEEVAAQSFVFFVAGFETSSTLMSFALYQISKNDDIAEKLRQEIDRVLESYKGKITYEALSDMKYLDQVVNETLRMYPPLGFVLRKSVEDYKISGNVVIEKNTKVVIPVQGIHYDKDYYPNPEIFDPERFSEESKKGRHPCAFLPFGEGPRNCIGMRFGLMQAKVGLVALLKKYKFGVNPKTVEPLEMAPRNVVLSANGGIWLNLESLDK